MRSTVRLGAAAVTGAAQGEPSKGSRCGSGPRRFGQLSCLPAVRRALVAFFAVSVLWVQPTAGDPSRSRDPAAPETQTVQASMLLERMGSALRSLDFEGILVYLLDNRMETLHLVHRVDGVQVQERLVSLSGPVRAVTRSHGRVTCTMRDGHPISVKSHSGRSLLRTQPIDPAALAGRYRLELQGSARVAGRETDVVSIGPLDALRYGYRLHLDRETGLPLKSDLIDLDGNTIEQIMFTSLTLGERKESSGPTENAPEPATDAASVPATAPGAAAWRFDRRPPGFEQTMHDAIQDRSGALIEHFVFSDRLSSYSVYVEPNAEDGLQGVTRMGAAHAAGRRVGDYQITAVGEVPAATVEAAVEGVSADSGGTQ